MIDAAAQFARVGIEHVVGEDKRQIKRPGVSDCVS
jgi:hypothetical protein